MYWTAGEAYDSLKGFDQAYQDEFECEGQLYTAKYEVVSKPLSWFEQQKWDEEHDPNHDPADYCHKAEHTVDYPSVYYDTEFVVREADGSNRIASRRHYYGTSAWQAFKELAVGDKVVVSFSSYHKHIDYVAEVVKVLKTQFVARFATDAHPVVEKRFMRETGSEYGSGSSYSRNHWRAKGYDQDEVAKDLAYRRHQAAWEDLKKRKARMMDQIHKAINQASQAQLDEIITILGIVEEEVYPAKGGLGRHVVACVDADKMTQDQFTNWLRAQYPDAENIRVEATDYSWMGRASWWLKTEVERKEKQA